MYKLSPVAGDLVFSVRLVHGKRVRWVLDYLDSKNYAAFDIDGKYFYRGQVVNGTYTELAKLAHNMGKGPFTFEVEVTPTAIVHRYLQYNNWVLLDRWDADKTLAGKHSFTEGKFGFSIPAKDEIGLSNLKFYPPKNP
jgi:hypothetical protein